MQISEADIKSGISGKWPNIRVGYAAALKANIIIRLEGMGSCCWDIYSRRGYKGETKELSNGEEYDVEFQPISIRRKNCPILGAEYEDNYYY